MSRWSDAATWVGDGLRREVFFFPSGGELLYGSLFAATEPSRRYGVLACNSWGVEADRSEPLLRSVSLETARRGGAGMVFHYPGYGDSHGDLAGLDLDDLSRAVVDAAAEAERRCPGFTWVLAGFMFGASVAALARRRLPGEPLLLVQPALRPGEYFRRLSQSSRPLAPGSAPREMMEADSDPSMAYGYPIPHRIAEQGAGADAAVAAALGEYAGRGAVVSHAKPQQPDFAPQRFERVEAPGTWRFGSQNNPRLAKATTEWLDRFAQGGETGG
jgi:hypothetical protein